MRQEYSRLLSDCTTFRIGGPVFCWIEAENLDDILGAIVIAERENKPIEIIGRGSNILAQDKGFDGVIVTLGKDFDYVNIQEDGIVKAGAAVSIPVLVKKCLEESLTGCEFLAGIPGSVGGAIFMNAGVRDIKDSNRFREIKDVIVDVDVLDLKSKGGKTFRKLDAAFSYRSSGFKGKCILGATFKLKKDKKDLIENRIGSFMKERQWMQGLGFPTAGSVFKNPDNKNSAGQLIDSCGLKGRRIGGAEISSVHANFIVNVGNAEANHVLELIDLAKNSVKCKFGIDLELELKMV